MAIDLNDKSSGGHTLTNNGATEVTTSLPFAASTIAVDCAAASSQFLTAVDHNDFSVGTTGYLSIEFWAKITSLSANNWAIFKGTTADFEYGILVGSATGTIEANFWSAAGSSRYRIYTNGSAVTTNTWYHIGITVDNVSAWADTNIKLYINGTANTDNYGGSSAATLNNSTQVFSLAKRTDSSVYFNGKLDEIRVWNDVRTPTEITDNKSIELTGTEAGLVAYYPFESLDSFIPKVIFI